MKTTAVNRQTFNQSVDQELFGLLISSVKDYAIFMIDPEGYILTWNKGAQAIKGYREDEIIGKHISIFYTEDEIAKNEPQENLRLAVKDGSVEREGWRVRKNGSIFWANIVFTPLYNDQNTLLGFAKVTRDMTDAKIVAERKELQNIELERRVKENTDKIIENEQRFRALIENSYDGISLLDKNFNTFYRSRSAVRIVGWEDDERARYDINDLIYPDDLTKFQQGLINIMKQPRVPIPITYRARHKNGHFIWLECVYINMLADKAIDAIVCNFRDITERKKAEEALNQTIKELSDYKYALDEASIVAITDHHGIIQHVNQNFCKISKFSEEELIGRDHRIINSGWHDKKFISDLWHTIAKGNTWRGELKNRAKDGSFYWVDTTIVPFLNKNGKPYQYLAIRSDITERKKAEEALTETVKELSDYKYALDESALVVITDKTGIVKHVNDNACRLGGFLPSEVVGRDVRFLNSGYHDQTFWKNMWETITKGAVWKGEICNKRKDGGLFWVETSIVPFLDSNGEPYQYLAIRFDITERKKAEELIRSKNAQIEDILERIADGFIALDKNMVYTYANKRVGEMTGKDTDSLIGKCVWDEFPDAANSATRRAFDEALREQHFVYNEDYYEHLDFWQENYIYPSAEGLSVFIRDISARKKAEREILQLNESLERKVIQRTEQLEAANKELEAFSYSVSHDLRTPLRAVSGFAMMLKDGYEAMTPENRNRFVNTIINNATLMGKLIDDLLDFSRLGRKEIRFTRVDMQALVNECINELTHNVSKIYKMTVEQLPACEADGSMIKQVWMNLIGNAMKYSGKNVRPAITIGAKTKDDSITYFVKDNGVGFDMKYADKLFGVFQRLHRKDEFEGTGVGLALVKRVADRHNGKLWAEARPGKGACFYFSLPVKQEKI